MSAILEPLSPAYATTCPYCLRPEREKCVTASGRELGSAHVARRDRANRLFRTREMWHVIREDDERFGLAAGDIVRTINYPWDAKVSVLFREWDGYEPECSQYLHAVSFLGFVPIDQEMR